MILATRRNLPHPGGHGVALVQDATNPVVLAQDDEVSQATGYQYLHEAIDVIAAHAFPELTDLLAHGRAAGWAFLTWTEP